MDYRDPKAGPYDLVYVYTQTDDNFSSGLKKAAEIARSGGAREIGVSEGVAGSVSFTIEKTTTQLRELGVDEGQTPIVGFTIPGNLNTGSEADVLVAYLLQKYELTGRTITLGVTTVGFHLFRAFITTVTTIKRTGAPIAVYAIPGVPLPWTESVVHSQGIVSGRRSELLVPELQRMERYRAPEFGGMLSVDAVNTYLSWRDDQS